MKPLNQQKRLISIFQFIGVYLLGFVLMGFAISSFQGVTQDEEVADKDLIAKLEAQLVSKDSLIEADQQVWANLVRQAQEADSLANSIQNLENLLIADEALGPAGDLSAARHRRDIEFIQRQILNQFVGAGGASDVSLQGKMKVYLNNAYLNMITARNTYQNLQESIAEDNTDVEFQLENAQLRAQLAQMQSDQQVGSQLTTCNQQLEQVRGQLETFAGYSEDSEGYAKALKQMVRDLRGIEGEIKTKLFGKNKVEKQDLEKKIDDLEDLVNDLTQTSVQMKAAAN